MHQAWNEILNIVALLGGAFVLGLICERLRQSAVLGYIAAGMLLGPGILGWIEDDAFITSVAELGVTLLMFTVGLEFSLKRLLGMGRIALLGGALQVAGSVLLFALVALAFGYGTTEALVLGMVIAPTSTALVLRVLAERAEADSVHGRQATGMLLLQDIALIPMVVAIAAMSSGAGPVDAHGGGSGEAPSAAFHILYEVGKALVVLGILIALFHAISVYLLPRLLTAAASMRNRELLILLAVSTAFGAAWITQHFGLSPALGAFLVGMLLAESPFATQLRADVSILRTLLVTLFFTSVGMLADVAWIGGHFVSVAVAVTLIIVAKALVTWVVLRVINVPHRYALATAMLLAPAGEFGFVLVQMGKDGAIIGEDTFRLIIAAIIGTLVLTPYLVAAAIPLGKWVDDRLTRVGLRDSQAEPAAEGRHRRRDHVIVIGFGPAGKGVMRALKPTGTQIIVVELNPRGIADARNEGLDTFLGDASQDEVLEHLDIHEARALVITIPDHNAALAIVRAVVQCAPKVQVIARSRYHLHAPAYLAAGAHVVLDEEEHVGSVLGERLVHTMTPRSMSGILRLPSFDADDEPIQFPSTMGAPGGDGRA